VRWKEELVVFSIAEKDEEKAFEGVGIVYLFADERGNGTGRSNDDHD